MEGRRLSDEKDEIIAQLRAAVAARDEFIAIAAHELRNPMTPVIVQVQLLLMRANRDGASPEMVGGLERLELAISRYMRRATALLEISRINAGQLSLQLADFDLAVLIGEAMRSYEGPAAKAGSSLRFAGPGPVSGRWDRLALEQVLDNLLSNAIRYGDGNSIDIVLEADDEAVAITVADHGIGIAEEDRQRIFDRFEQAATGGRRQGGFGIGLWLARQLIEAHDGSIEVATEPGKGSAFTVRLPRRVDKK